MAVTSYVYVADSLTAPPSEYLAYVHRMSAAARKLVELGFCPLNPAADLVEGLTSPDVLPVECYQRRSLEVLRLLEYAQLAGHFCCLLVLASATDEGRESSGVAAEIALARELDIPVVYSLSDVCAMRGNG